MFHPEPRIIEGPERPFTPAPGKPKIALQVGHGTECCRWNGSKLVRVAPFFDPGAVSPHNGEQEHALVRELAHRVAEMGAALHPEFEWHVLMQTESFYTAHNAINAGKYAVCVALHLNAHTGTATGAMCCYWHRSVAGQRLATLLKREFDTALHGPKNPPVRYNAAVDANGRGASILYHTDMPCVIAEPYFLDNLADRENARKKDRQLATAYVNGIAAFLHGK